jgi:G6PDH family F420-dependent oxidoreductase
MRLRQLSDGEVPAMTEFGYSLICEQRDSKSLVREARLAEEAGFDFATISDHFHPWLDSQGESPFAWSVLGAVAERTTGMGLMTMVTCPFLRYHPAVVAQAAATVAQISDGRFSLGLGAGENLNEHVVGRGWPSPRVRHEMLTESVRIIRLLFEGGHRSFHGRHLDLESARLYSLPDAPPPILVAAGGERSVTLAAQEADGMIAVAPDPKLVSRFHELGRAKPAYGQIAVCWAEDEAKARRTAHEFWRFGVPGWPVMAELPNPFNFEAATGTVREEDVAAIVPCGPDPERHAEGIRKFVAAGFDHVAIVQAGPDQEGFLEFWAQELRPRLSSSAAGTA